jgi:hypothetical protein
MIESWSLDDCNTPVYFHVNKQYITVWRSDEVRWIWCLQCFYVFLGFYILYKVFWEATMCINKYCEECITYILYLHWHFLHNMFITVLKVIVVAIPYQREPTTSLLTTYPPTHQNSGFLVLEFFTSEKPK